ncbi:MAG TPA: hypothetical protein VFW40_13005 [Capsulimonadaceae bacterium]|nr:hypothetical protein [Capsulimonadaceae bacterium]
MFQKAVDASNGWTRHATWFILLLAGAIVLQVVKDSTASRPEKGRFEKGNFLDLYTLSLYKAIDVLPEYRQATEVQILEGLQAALAAVSAVVASYHNKGDLNVNSCIMVAEPPSSIPAEQFHQKVRFSYPSNEPRTYTHVLRIVAWGKIGEDTTSEFYLPVHQDQHQVLFGAPKAFVTGDLEHHPNTRAIREGSKEIADQPRVVKNEIVSYFRTAKFRSFVSMRVPVGDHSHSVLSIHSNKTHVFGIDEVTEQEIEKYVRPFAAVISCILQELVRVHQQAEETQPSKRKRGQGNAH